MGWIWGKDKDDDTNNNPLRDLDPSLRDFLEKESPVKYTTSPPQPPPPSELLPPPQEVPTPSSTSESTTPAVPRQSLYPDGRYAHLWKNYRPLSDIENATKTDQEKLLDVLEGYKRRKAEIARAALENCAFEQDAVNECFTSGGWGKRMTMCRAENKKFERCYLMQFRFLKALGYLSTYDRPPAVDEEIQMHADTLFHRMLSQEKAIEAARAADLPIPTFPPIISPAASTAPNPNTHLPALDGRDRLKPEARAVLNERLKKMTPEERALEEHAVAVEAQATEVLGRQIGEIYEDQEKHRKERREKGTATIGDTIAGFFGF